MLLDHSNHCYFYELLITDNKGKSNLKVEFNML